MASPESVQVTINRAVPPERTEQTTILMAAVGADGLELHVPNALWGRLFSETEGHTPGESALLDYPDTMLKRIEAIASSQIRTSGKPSEGILILKDD